MNSRLVKVSSSLLLDMLSRSTSLNRAAVCRAFSSAATATKSLKKVVDFDMGKLVKPLEAEIEFNQKFIEAEDISLKTVETNFSKLLRDQCWDVKSTPNSTVVEMRTSRGDMEVLIRFDAELVAQSINSGTQELDEDIDEEDLKDQTSVEAEDEDFSEEDEIGAQPYNFTVELRRPGVLSGKFVEMELEAVPGPMTGNQAADEVYINSIAIRHEDEGLVESYAGPEYTSLDEELRSAFDSWATRNLRQLIPFIGEYSKAKEAQEYNAWLKDLKSFTTS